MNPLLRAALFLEISPERDGPVCIGLAWPKSLHAKAKERLEVSAFGKQFQAVLRPNDSDFVATKYAQVRCAILHCVDCAQFLSAIASLYRLDLDAPQLC